MEGNGEEEWVTPNTPIEVSSFISVYAGKRHARHTDRGIGKMTKKTGYGLGIDGCLCEDH